VVLVAVGIWLMLKLREATSPDPGTYLTTGKKVSPKGS
jgi:hypothetical protein